MARSSASNFVQAPVPITPRNQAVVDAAHVHFQWEEVPSALEYRLQVALDTAFDETDLVFEQNVGERTELVVRDTFEPDEVTHFWRILVRREPGGSWESGDLVESFISATEEKVQAAEPRPEDEEELGPVGGLIRGTAHEGAAALKGEEEIEDPATGQRVEVEGVEAGQILGIAFAILAAICGLIVALFVASDMTYQVQRQAVVGLAGYPNLEETEVQSEVLLQQYDLVNDRTGTYRIPIDEAMKIMVNEELQDPNREVAEELSVLSEN